jgi:hypothetical protein
LFRAVERKQHIAFFDRRAEINLHFGNMAVPSPCLSLARDWFRSGWS